MYVASPLSGWLADHFGRLPVIAAGALMLIFAVGLAGVAPGTQAVPVILALFLNGVGWNLAFVAGSALLTDALAPAERASVQGFADLLMGLMGAIGAVRRDDPRPLGLRDPERGGRGAGPGPARGHLAETARARFPVEPELMLRLLPDLRYLGAGTLLNSIGMMGELVVLGWLALELTDSPFLVGAAMGARALPLFFVGVPAGVIADRLPRQRLLIATGAGQALCATLLGVLALTGAVSLAQLVLLTFVGGILRGLERMTRQAAHDVVRAAGLVSGLAILGVAMLGWLVGSSARAPSSRATGQVPTSSWLPPTWPAGSRAPGPRGDGGRAVHLDSMWRGITSFVDAVNRDRMLLVLMMLTAGAEVLGFAHQALLPSLARDVLTPAPRGSACSTRRSVGGILALLASLRGFTAGSGALFVAVLVSFGGTLIALGVAPYVVGFVGVALLVLLANAAGPWPICSRRACSSSGPRHLRGRAGGAWVVIGLAPLGQIRRASLFGSARRWARAASGWSPSRVRPRCSTPGCARSESGDPGRVAGSGTRW
jgi:hypothetical protein